jgi:hypothetical protein
MLGFLVLRGPGLPPDEVQKAENSSENPEKSGNLYFYEILQFLRVLTISLFF